MPAYKLVMQKSRLLDSMSLKVSLMNWGKESVWVVLGQVISFIGVLLGVRLLTSMLSPEIYGELALCISVVMLVFYIVGETFSELTMRFFTPAREQGWLADFYHGVRTYFFKIIAFVFVMGLLILLVLALTGNIKLVAVGVPILLFSMFSSANGLMEGIRNGARDRKVVAFNQALFQWLRFLLAALFIWLAGASAAVALWGYAFASLLVVISQICFLRRAEFYPAMQLKRNPEKGFQYVSTMLNYARPFLVMGGFTWLLSFADRWALSLFCPMSEVGYYAALYQVGYFPMIFASRILLQLVSPVLYERAGGNDYYGHMDGLNRFNRRLTLLVLGLSFVLWIMLHQIHKPLFALFVAQDYQSVSYLLPWTVLSAGIYSAGSIPLVSVLSRFESGRILPMKIVTTLLGVICYITGAYFYKLEGLVFGSLIFSFIYLICAYRLNIK
ncbi:MAG: hypothetical protein KKD92_08960 [Proteobacteria bacterium]|nr:hypothetical protein [Pseudomonadota bacterium]